MPISEPPSSWFTCAFSPSFRRRPESSSDTTQRCRAPSIACSLDKTSKDGRLAKTEHLGYWIPAYELALLGEPWIIRHTNYYTDPEATTEALLNDVTEWMQYAYHTNPIAGRVTLRTRQS